MYFCAPIRVLHHLNGKSEEAPKKKEKLLECQTHFEEYFRILVQLSVHLIYCKIHQNFPGDTESDQQCADFSSSKVADVSI